MNRILLTLAGLLMVVCVVVAVPQRADAQTPPSAPGRITSGTIPPDGGFGLIVFSGGTFAQLVTASGCPAAQAVFWFTLDGNFVVYVAGSSVGAVNAGAQAAFPTGAIPSSIALIGRCVPATAGGIVGTVSRAVSCQSSSTAIACVPLAYQATVIVYNTLALCPAFSCGEVARATSSASGAYQIPLPSGIYTVVAQRIAGQAGGSANPAPLNVMVPAGSFVTVNWTFDGPALAQ